jgi:leader peptidase (prepilin peptidase)/N-methyltransferase
MTWTDAGHPVAGLAALLGGLLVGWFIPLLIARMPEPKPSDEEQSEPAEPAAAKELYADVAVLPHLALRTAVATGAGAGIVAASVGPEWPLAFLLPMIPFCVALAVIDARTKLLPSLLILPLHAVALVAAGAVALASDDLHSLWRGLIAMAVFRSIFWVIWWFNSTGLGFGDVRLTAMLTFGLGYLGWPEAVVWVYVALPLFVLPRLVAALVRRDRSRLKVRTPFGPSLIVAAPVAVALGPWIATSLGY